MQSALGDPRGTPPPAQRAHAGAGGVTDVLQFEDLSPRDVTDPVEEAWLERLSTKLRDNDHVLRLTGRVRDDEEDEPPLARGPHGRWWATGRFIGEIRFEGRRAAIAPRLGIDVVGAWLAPALDLTIAPKAATRRRRTADCAARQPDVVGGPGRRRSPRATAVPARGALRGPRAPSVAAPPARSDSRRKSTPYSSSR